MIVSRNTPTGREGKQETIGTVTSIRKDLPGSIRVSCHYGFVVMSETEAARVAAWVLQREDK